VLFIAVCNGLVFWSENRLDSAFTALLITSNTVWAAMFAPLLPGERRLGAAGWSGVALGFAGTALILSPWRSGAADLVAAGAVIASTVIWAATALWVRRIRERFEPFAMTVVQMASGAVVLLLIAGVRGESLVGPVTFRAAAALAYLVVFGSLVAFSAYFYLLRHMEAARVATSTYINPVVAMILGVVLLGEVITWNMLAGVAVVLVGVALVMRERA
jgi:drug/metabolite transporter (DMT)-like permease